MIANSWVDSSTVVGPHRCTDPNHQESRFTSGFADSEKVSAARIALWNFRRDNAGTKEEKIKLQELLVQEHATNLAAVKARSDVGVRTSLDVLLATDKLLEEKQVLVELRMKK